MYLSLNIKIQDVIFGFEIKSGFSVSCVIPEGAVREWGITSHSGLNGNGGLPPTGGCAGMEDYLPQGAVREWMITSRRGLYGNGGLPPTGGCTGRLLPKRTSFMLEVDKRIRDTLFLQSRRQSIDNDYIT